MSIVSDQVGVLLGRSPLSPLDEKRAEIFENWARAAIERRSRLLGRGYDEEVADEVVVQAVASHMSQIGTDGATRVQVQVDDAQITRDYKAAAGRIAITDDWWMLLGLALTTTAMRPVYHFPRACR